jgi:hypothetical protein
LVGGDLRLKAIEATVLNARVPVEHRQAKIGELRLSGRVIEIGGQSNFEVGRANAHRHKGDILR